MQEINIQNQKDLEKEFANDFSSPIFPILSELYLKNKDYLRAEKVCKIGLKHDPNNINGYYILTKIHLYNNQLNDAEKLLKILLEKSPLHINALRLIVALQEQLNKSMKIRSTYLAKLLDIFPNDKEIKQKLLIINNTNIKKEKKTTTPSQSNNKIMIRNQIDFKIQPNMATLTFVEILIEQKHYHQALHVLSIIEDSSSKNKKIKEIKEKLEKLIFESDK